MSSLEEINSQIEQHNQMIAGLQRQAEQLRNAERAGVIEELRRKIAEYGITATDLRLTGARGAGRRSLSAAPAAKTGSNPKYRSPTGETWSGGRGRKPRWVSDALAAGKSLSEFEIQ